MARPPITKARPYTPQSGAFSGRTFHTEREYRDALAKLKGFSSWHEQQRAAKKVTTRAYGSLRTSEKQARGRALKALSLMRTKGDGLSAAAREAHTTPNNVTKWVGSELEKRGGRQVASKGDRLIRRMRVISTEGVLDVEIRGSRQASTVGRHLNAVKRFLNEGDDEPLRRFEGQKVAGYQLETDPEVIEELGRVGALSFEELQGSSR